MAPESSSPHEDSKSSSDEAERLDQNYEYSGSGRSYECVFCRRGFTTAQALGGHMNIHRKHRAPKTNPSSNNYSADHLHRRHQDPLASSNLAADDHHHREVYASFRPFFAIQSYPQVHFGHDDHQVHVNYQTYNNLSTIWGSNCSTRPSQDFNDLLRESWRGTALSLGIVAPRHEEEEEEEEEEDDDEDHDDHNSQKILGGFVKDGVELDLELRLGYYP